MINFVLGGLHITVIRLTNPWPSNSRSNWNLEMLIFVEGGKPENPERNPRSKDENQQQTQVYKACPSTSVNFLEVCAAKGLH